MNGSINPHSNNATWWQAALMICGQTEVEQRNIQSVWKWCLVWAIGFCGVVAALKVLPQLSAPMAWLLAATPVVLFFPVLLACLRFIREADEFMRKVQLEGIAIGFAVAFVFCLGYHMLEKVGAPPLSMIVVTVPLTIGWIIGSFIVAFRHR
jgi:hypothetical protein